MTGQVTQHGVTFTFASARPVGQYANGDFWVQGPVTITSITPTSTLHNGLNGDGTSYTGRVVHGAMVNPGNRSLATGGLLANNASNTVQGWDSIGSSKPRVTYSALANVDPGATGSALNVTSGSVVKFVSALSGLPNGAENRPAGLDMAVLTVVSAIPAADAIRPGVSRSGGKGSPCRASQFNIGVLQNLAPTASAPTYAQALDWIDRYIEVSQPDSINNPVAKAINNHPEYGRDIGNNLHRALLALHLNTITAEQKRTMLSHLAAIADDIVSRAEEGAITLAAGGGNAFKKAVIAVCAAALGPYAPASWLSFLSYANRTAWAEDSQIFRISGFDVALPRFTGDGRPRSAYTQQMVGSSDWGENPVLQPENSGSNWNAVYRDIVGYSLYPGTLAVELTIGAKALWDDPEFWLYMDSIYLRRTEGGAGNTMLAFGLEMTNAYRPAKVTAPTIADASVKDGVLWLRFDQALNEIATAPAATDFVVNVNGTARTVSSVSVWRQNCGLALATPVIGSDVVTVNYTSGTNKLRSVDNVNVASFTGRAVTNRTDKVGGPNAAFPVVRFETGDVRRIGGTNKLAAAASQRGTLALLKFKFAALPAADSRILGENTGASPLQIILRTTGRLEFRFVNLAGSIINRPETPVLTPNIEYDILVSIDNTQATAAAGANCYINGAAQTLNNFNYTSGGTIAWDVAAGIRWNNTDNVTFEFGAFWLDTTTRVDLTNSANRAKFTSVTAGNLDILTRGDGITGAIPAQFHVGNADQWNDGAGINRGTGQRFFVEKGLVTQVSGSEWR